MSKPQLTDAEIDLVCRNVASLVGQGLKKGEIRAQLSLSHYELSKYLEHPTTQGLIRDMAEETSKTALNTLKKGIARMADLTLKALENNLKRNSMQAVNTALQVMGALERDKAAVADTSITVVLPGEVAPQPLEVKRDAVDTDPE